ncbi:MAG: hypothetical protein ACM30E_06555 [Nitrososphaerales archaeon]
MPFGELFTGAFQRIWWHKKLWLLAMLGLALTGVGMIISSFLSARWMSSYFAFIAGIMRNPGLMPGRAFGNFMSSMSSLWVLGALVALLSLIGYVINLVARSAIINEAAHAWRNQATDTGRGLAQGSQRAIYVFLLDLLWLLPALVLGLGGLIAFFVLTAGTVAAARQDGGGGLIVTSWVAFACCGACLGLLYYLVFVIFSPLMYQSAVAGRRDFGSAVSEGWSLARANLGAMIVFWLLLLLTGFVLSALRGIFDAIFSLPLMSGLFQSMSNMMQGFGQGFVPATRMLSGPLFVVLSLVSTVLWFLIATFTQALSLTLYTGVYQHLTGVGPAPAVGTPSPGEPAPVRTVTPEPEPLVVPPPPPTEEEPPPAL